MALWDDVKKAAKDATAHANDPHAVLGELFATFRPKTGEPPTIVVDGAGNTALERKQSSLAILGKSLLLLIVSLGAMGLTWLTTALIGLYLLVQKLFGLHVRVQQPAR